MWAKIGSFFKNFFSNAKSDPVSTLKGIGELAAAGGVCYGMATGVLPVSVGAPMASGLAGAGIHAIGTDSTTGKIQPTAEKTEALVQVVGALAPSVVDQVVAIKAESDKGQRAVDTYRAVQEALGQIIPPTDATTVK